MICMKRIGGFWQASARAAPEGREILQVGNLGDCELRAGCEVTGKVLCYVRYYPDVCNIRALAGNEFFFWIW